MSKLLNENDLPDFANINAATSHGASVASGDEVLIADISDSNNIKKTTAQDIADLGSGGSPVAVDLANNATDEITDLTRVNTANDSNSIITNNTGSEILIDMNKNWPTADSVASLSGNNVESTDNVAVSTPSAGEIPIYHGTNSQFENATLTGGTNVSITNADASVTIDATDTDTTYSAGSGLTLSSQTFSLDESYGPTWTGTHDFTGANVDLPTASAPSPTTEGRITWDTDDDQLKIGNGSGTTTVGGGSTSPGGSDTQVQFNDGGSFGASSNFTWDDNKLNIVNTLDNSSVEALRLEGNRANPTTNDEVFQSFYLDGATGQTEFSRITSRIVDTSPNNSGRLDIDVVDLNGSLTEALRIYSSGISLDGGTTTIGSSELNLLDGKSALTTPSSTDTFTNKTLDADGTGNSLSNIGADESKLGDGLEDDGSDNIKTEEMYSFTAGMRQFADGLSNEEIERIQLQSGETFVVDRIEMRKKGGGSSTSASVRVQDNTASTTIGSQDLGGTTKNPGSSGTANLVLIQVSNSTGSSINASVTVTGRIQGA